MKYFIVYDVQGKILRTGSCPDEMVEIQAGTGEMVIEGVASEAISYVQNGQLVTKPKQPSPHHLFDYTIKQWVDPRTLQDIKDVKWAEIKGARNATEFGIFTWNGSTFDSDAASQSRIQGAAQLATLALMNNQMFSVDWTLADNTVRTLSAQDMIMVGTAMGEHITMQHTKARLKRKEIEAATIADQVAAITW